MGIGGDVEAFDPTLPHGVQRQLEILALRLVDHTLAAEVPVKEAVAQILHRQVQSPILAVDRQPHLARQRGRHPKAPEERIAEGILHIRGVAEQIVQAQLVQAVIGLPLFELTEVQPEAVALAARIIRDIIEAGIPLRGEGDVFNALAVDADRCVYLVLSMGAASSSAQSSSEMMTSTRWTQPVSNNVSA